MQTLAASPQTVNKAFRATVYDEPGTLVQLGGVIYFATDDDVVPFEVEMAPWTTILGEVGLYETLAIMDQIHGGYAAIACGRAN